MEIEITSNRETWRIAHSTIKDFPGKIYYSFEYLSLCQLSQSGVPFTAIGKVNSTIVIYYPFLLKKVSSKISEDEVFSIEAPYGYGGPAIFTDNNIKVDEFFKLFTNWCNQNKIIAEFIRFNPLTKNFASVKDICKIELNRKTVGIILHKSFTNLLGQMTPARRRNYKKAIKLQLQFKITKKIDNFKNLYVKTMKRVQADEFYYFSDEYFNEMLAHENFAKIIAEVSTKEGMVIASAIFLLDKETLHFHLGASNADYNSFNSNTFLMISMADYAAKLGYKELHLGGGISNAPDDKLFKYKKGFSPNEHNFYIGKKVYNHKKYNDMSLNWTKLTGKQPHKLLHYHDGVSL